MQKGMQILPEFNVIKTGVNAMYAMYAHASATMNSKNGLKIHVHLPTLTPTITNHKSI